MKTLIKPTLLLALALMLGLKANAQEGDEMELKNKWVLESLMGDDLGTGGPNPPTIQIYAKEKRYTGYTGCNNYSGKVTSIDEDQILFGPVSVTKKACKDNEEMEADFLDALSKVKFWALTDDGMLELMDEDDEAVLVFGIQD